ncbi:hypothetical protein [Amycolatopsis sulphurea]|uniref:hypothetical protein n=1 Tax=Amycolatopsis sulphurea TaxID=76022 RepID=UPI000BF4CDDC|nr:hypothetical protein [Amycolatopsis sulphurea]
MEQMQPASDKEINMAEEVGCAKGQLDRRLCTMTPAKLAKVSGDERKLVDELEVLAKKEAAKSAATSGQARALASPALLGKVLAASGNPVVRKLSNKAGNFADWANRAVTSASLPPLTEETSGQWVKTAVYLAATFTPPLGDLFSLADAISTGDIEQGVVAVTGVAAFAIGLAAPPVGAVIAVGLAIYTVGKALWNFFRGRARDWAETPPGTLEELVAQGADIQLASRKLNGEPANLIFSHNHPVATQTLLLDSKWTKVNTGKTPVKYTIKAGKNDFFEMRYECRFLDACQGPAPGLAGDPRPVIGDASLVVWQNGKAISATCKAAFRHTSLWVDCGDLTKSVTIAKDKPAVVEVGYILDAREDLSGLCQALPCVLREARANVTLKVHADRPYHLDLPVKVGVA